MNVIAFAHQIEIPTRVAVSLDQSILANRTALPDALRVLVKEYPRLDWEAHKNFDDLTRFWLDRHLMFREVLQQLQGETTSYLDQGDDQYGAKLYQIAGFFLNQLHTHHKVEDHHYFPMLKPLDSRVSHGFDLLDSDHKELDGLIHQMAEKTNAALQTLQKKQDAKPAVGKVSDTLVLFEKFLDRHLTDEEELVVPVILKYGFKME